tara:strand:- start:570 stop:1130 length:561 start_codon:yes stop_codon:yes gene_type:complete
MPGGNRKGGGLTSSATYKLAAENPDTGTTGARGGTMAKKTVAENPDTGMTGARGGSMAKSTGYAPFKMKGSPMQRNFGIGSPAQKEESKVHKHEDHHDEEVAGMTGMMKTGSPVTKRDHTNPLYDIPVIKAGSPVKKGEKVHRTEVIRNDEGQVIKRKHYDVHGNVISIVRHQEEGKPIPETTKKQ